MSFFRFGQCSDLIHLKQQSVRSFELDGAPDPLRVRTGEIVRKNEREAFQSRSQFRPVVPIIFGQPVFNADDGKFFRPPVDYINEVSSR